MSNTTPAAGRRSSAAAADDAVAASAVAGAASSVADDELVWTQVVPTGGQAPTGRRGHTCVLIEGVLLLFGGQDGNNFYNDVYSFQLEGLVWSPMTCAGVAPLSRSYHTATVFRSCMYIFGGTGRARVHACTHARTCVRTQMRAHALVVAVSM